MWKSIALVFVGLVGCVDGEEAPVAVTAPVAPPPARALVARQMPQLPSLPEAPTSDPWAPDYVPEPSSGVDGYAHDEDGDEPIGPNGECEGCDPSPPECPEGCGMDGEGEPPDEGLDERDFEGNHDYEDEGAGEAEPDANEVDPDEPIACVGDCHEGA